MPAGVFDRPVVPVASRADARATARALSERVDPSSGRVTAVHVVEKAGGAPDKASVAQRERRATEMFEAFVAATPDDLTVRTEIGYGTDVAATVLGTAREADASAVVFTPRGGSRLAKFLTGDVTDALVSNADRPVVVLPTPRGGDDD